MTFSANIDYSNIERVKVYAIDLYPDFLNSDFEYDNFLQEEGTGLYYEMAYPEFDFKHEMNLSNDNMLAMLRVIDANYPIQCRANDYWISFAIEDLPNLKRKLIKAINSAKSNNHVREPHQEGIMYYGGINEEYIASKLAIMLEIVDNAQQRNLAISCG